MLRLLTALYALGVLSPSAAAQDDLQGVWHNRWVVHLERPASTTGSVLSQTEADAYAEANASRPGRSIEAPFFGPETVAPLMVRGEYRAGMVIDPPDGRIPYSSEGLRILQTITPPGYGGPESRGVSERCLGGWGRPPILTNAVGNLRQIVQTRDSVVIWSDYNAEVRIIPINGRRAVAGSFQGVSTGHWEGRTLVVETTDFRAEEPLRFSPWHRLLLTPQTLVTERFTRVSEDELAYTFTVEDPSLYERAWTAESVFRRSDDHVLEFACHEGNYSMANILLGARVQERQHQQRE